MVSAEKATKPKDLPLVKAFQACEAVGVMIAQNVACCSGCSEQIMWRVEDCPLCRGPFTGYAFYHFQAADRAVREGYLRMYFEYFAEESTDEQCLEIGRKVVRCLKTAGLSVNWAETINDTIVIKDLSSAERRYLYDKMGPERRKWVNWARELAQQKGPAEHWAEGEMHHDCDCMKFSCFCGSVRDLDEVEELAYGEDGDSADEDDESEWETCSENDLQDDELLLVAMCKCADPLCHRKHGNALDADIQAIADVRL